MYSTLSFTLTFKSQSIEKMLRYPYSGKNVNTQYQKACFVLSVLNPGTL